jgi:hypothetical protein
MDRHRGLYLFEPAGGYGASLIGDRHSRPCGVYALLREDGEDGLYQQAFLSHWTTDYFRR